MVSSLTLKVRCSPTREYLQLTSLSEMGLQEFRDQYPSLDAMYWIAANTTSEGRAARTFPPFNPQPTN
jgi:hypothetical protein